MDKTVVRDVPNKLTRSLDLFDDLDTHAFAELLGAASDAVLVLSPNGEIADLASGNSDFEAVHIADWVGKPFIDVVTSESRVKIEGLLSDVRHRSQTEGRQVNHAIDPQRMVEIGLGETLPVVWRLVSLAGLEGCVALGSSIADTARTQQRLVSAQLELESEYRLLSNRETKFRAVFQSVDLPLFILDGNGKVQDANSAALGLTGKDQDKLVGTSALDLFVEGDRAAITNQVRTAGAGQSGGLALTQLQGSTEPVHVSLSPFREHGAIHFVATITPTSEGVGTGNDKSTELNIDALPEAIVRTDRAGTILDTNERFLDFAQITSGGGAVGRNLSGWLGGSHVDMSVLLAQLHDDGLIRRFSTTLRTELGSILNVMVSASMANHGDNAKDLAPPQIHFVILEARGADSRLIVEPGSAMSPQSDFTQLVGRVHLKELVRDASDAIEKMCIEAALRQTGNNRASAAEILGVSRQSLYIKLKRHGLESFKG
ncbi:MAG: transcriptional regulator PpsR [Pseudomonadota bacterium]